MRNLFWCFCYRGEAEHVASATQASSFDAFLQPEALTGDNMFFCPQCSALRDSCKETSILYCGKVLILQLSRFSNTKSVIVKDTSFVECLPVVNHTLKVPIQASDPVSFSNRYSLMATVNHSGTFEAGHYWAFIKDVDSNTWLKCNDRSVVEVPSPSLNNNLSYVLFYVRI